MPRLALKTAGRQFRRQFGAAIRQNLIRALTELITNSDDSYRRIDRTESPNYGRIDVIFDRKKRRISVLDWAEGMDAQDMARVYPNYGAATSGLYEGYEVRGYFGKGLKDVLFSMESGLVESIKDGYYHTAEFEWNEDQPVIIVSDLPKKANKRIRQRVGILEGDGTRVSFVLDDSISLPRHHSLLKNLSNYYMLRLINSNDQRHIKLQTRNANQQKYENEIRYHFPAGELLLQGSFPIDYLNPLQVDLHLYRASSPLTQSGEDREGGLLIFDNLSAVLDLTLFGFDNDEYAAHLYGMLEIKNFRELLIADENVLTDTRDGLEKHHRFTQALTQAIESRLRPIVDREREIQLENTPRELSEKQQKRLGDSLERINFLLSDLTGLEIEKDPAESNGRVMPPNDGIEFRPQNLRLRERSKSAVRLRVDTSLIRPGTRVSITSPNNGIRFEPQEFLVPADPHSLVISQTIILSSSKVGDETTIEARAGSFQTQMQTQVIPNEYPKPPDGMAFVPDVLRVANNSRRRTALYIDRTSAQPGEKITFQVDSPQIEIGRQSVVLKDDDFQNGIARIQLPVKGTGIGRRAVVKAKLNGQEAALSLEVVSKTEKKRRGPLLLTGFRFDASTPSRVRASYDEETGLIWIYLQNPVVKRYFQDLPLKVALNTPHCQILLAEILLEQVAWVARRKMLETGAAMYVGDNHTEEDLAAVRKFMHEHGDKIHSWVADDQAIARIVKSLS